MLGRSSAWGIDVGEATIRAVKVSVEKGLARIVALDVIHRPRGSAAAGYIDRDEQFRAAVTQLLSQNPIGRDTVAISPPGAGFDRFIQLPPVEKKRIPQIVSFEARQQIPFPLEQVVWDYQPVTTDPAPGQEIEVGLFAFRAEVIENFLSNLNQCGTGADMIGMGRLALYNFIMFDRPPSAGTMVVDFGASSTDVIIMHAGNFRVRSIPFAGDTITKALQNKFGISQDEAEDLKRKAGQAGQSRQVEKLLNVMRPTIDKIVGQVVQTLGFFRSQFQDLKVDQCWLVGDGFKLAGAEELFRRALDCPVQRLGDLHNVALGEEVLTSPYRNDLASFGTAIGLALQAMGLGPVKINLLPKDMLMQREVSRKKPFAIATLLAIGLTMGSLYITHARGARVWPQISRKLTSKISSIEKNMKKRSEAENLVTIEKRRDRIAKLGDGRLAILDTVNKISDVFKGMPVDKEGKGIYLTSLKADMLSRRLAENELSNLRLTTATKELIPRDKAVMLFVLSAETEQKIEYVTNELVNKLQKHFPDAYVVRWDTRVMAPAAPADEAPALEPAPGPAVAEDAGKPLEINEFEVSWQVPLLPPEPRETSRTGKIGKRGNE